MNKLIKRIITRSIHIHSELIGSQYAHSHAHTHTHPHTMVSPTIVQFGSDLHTEHNKSLSIRPVAEILLLGGDIGNPFDPNYKTLLQTVSDSFKSTYIVSGNHEYHYFDKWRDMSEVDDKIQSICEGLGNVHFLHNSTQKLTDGLNIFGSTLWTYLPSHYKPGFDNAKIWKDGKRVTNDELNKLNQIGIKSIKDELDKCKKSGEKLLVLTHHPPSFQMQADKYKNYPNSMRFYNNLDNLFQYPLAGWICGHTHTRLIQQINGIPCAINAHGYQHENKCKTLLSHTISI